MWPNLCCNLRCAKMLTSLIFYIKNDIFCNAPDYDFLWHKTLNHSSTLWHGSRCFLFPSLPPRTFLPRELRSEVGDEAKMPWTQPSYIMVGRVFLLNKWFSVCYKFLVNFKNKIFCFGFILSIVFRFIIVFCERFAELHALSFVKFHILPLSLSLSQIGRIENFIL